MPRQDGKPYMKRGEPLPDGALPSEKMPISIATWFGPGARFFSGALSKSHAYFLAYSRSCRERDNLLIGLSEEVRIVRI